MTYPLTLGIDSTSVLLFGVTFWLSYVVVKVNARKPTGKECPPCLPSLPFIGSLPFIPTDLGKLGTFFLRKAEELGPVFAFHSGNRYTLVLNGRNAIDEALVKRAYDFADRSVLIFERNYASVNQKGLAHNHYNPEYKIRRKLSVAIMKIFGFGASKVTEPKIHREIEAMIEEVTSFKGEPFSPIKLLSMSVSNVILSIVFGHRFDYTDSQFQRLVRYSHEYVTSVPLLIDIIPVLQYVPWMRRKIMKILKVQKSFFEILEEEIQNGVDNSEVNFVSKYIEARGQDYDKEELLYVLRDLIMAGSDTSMNTLLWAMITLANNPKVQSSIREEIDSVVPKTRLPSLEDKPNLPYTEASMTEVMRWRTLAPFGIPRQTLRDTEVHGFHVPVGTQVIANLWSAHMDSKVWKEPEKFQPERFLDRNGKFFGGDRVIPFALGRRSCLGEVLARAEIFLFISAFVQQFEILPPEGQASIDDLEVVTGISYPLPFNIRLIPRDSNL